MATPVEKESHAKEVQRLDQEMGKLVEQRRSLESKHSTRTEDYRSSQLELNDLINEKT